MMFPVKMYVGGFLKNQRIAYDYLPGEREEWFVRDFDADGTVSDGVWEGPFTEAAAVELARLLNERNKEVGVEYRTVLDVNEARRRSEA